MWLAIVLWMLAVLLGCGYAFVLLVAQAFTRRSRGESLIARVLLGPGLRLGRDRALAIFLVSWASWSLLGSLVIWTLFTLRN